MAVLGSSNFYYDFLNSEAGTRFISDEAKRDFLCRRVDSLLNHWDDALEGLERIRVGDKKKIKVLNDKIDGCKFLLNKVDGFISLCVYRKLFKGELDSNLSKGLASKYFVLLKKNPDTQLDLSEEEKQLQSKFLEWCETTTPLTYCCWKPNDTKRDSTIKYDLERQIQKAKQQSESIDSLEQSDIKTINKVCFLYKTRCFRGVTFPSIANPVLVLKGCSSESKNKKIELATSHLEVLIYDLAVLLKIDRFFVPTKIEVIKTRKFNYEGSVQPYIRGSLLSVDDENTRPDFCFRDFVSAIFASIMIGTADLHLDNIMVDEKENIPKFFDNSRSMMHSNGVVLRECGALMLSYFNLLLLLPETFDKLTEGTKKQIGNDLDEYFDENNELEKKIFKKMQAAKAAYPFPPKWIFADQAVIAQRERLQNLQSGIVGSVAPIDLVFAADPIHKALVSVMVAITYKEMGDSIFGGDDLDKVDLKATLTRNHMSSVFYYAYKNDFVQAILKDALDCKLDVGLIFKISDETKGWRLWIERIINYVDSAKASEKCDKTLGLSYNEILNFLKIKAIPDYKDPSKEDDLGS